MARIQLTDREDDVLALVIGGLSNDEIAARLAISRRTVEAHLRALFRKTGVTRRTQLAALYQRNDMTAAEPSGPEAPGAVNGPAPPLSRQRRDLTDCERQLRAYAAAVRGLADRQFPLFEERVEITAMVGEESGQDVIIERRRTRPKPYLTYRILSPIMSWPDGPSEADDLALAWTVDGQDTHVDVHLVRDVDGRLRVLILFQPGLGAETEWVLRYHSPKLWDPLRDTGQDILTWATATFEQRHSPKIDELTLNVVFPSSWTGERLTEDSNRGMIHTERLSTGQTQLTWHQEAPGAGGYRWELRGSRGSGA
ncbi:MAG: helix-turn-helix transcriptional regulator [Pseudonocardiales bacterium]|nr:helix-turn-helix transcriptional regulator [Pseudonocardiales bacterium]MBV9032432.1 helix-turn-helix transcriptional regulator [Pseudonocardiales bacterium]